MPTPDAADCELIVERMLTVIRTQFESALEDTRESGNAFVAHNTELRVDQVRRLVASTRAGDRWTVRDGKHCLATATDMQRGGLTAFVGGNRYLTGAQVFLILADLAGDKPARAGESTVAALINLLVVEPAFYPQRALAIWLTVVRALVTQHWSDDLHEMLPDVSSSFDVLHAELPASGEYVDLLRPHPERPGAVPWPVYEMQLLAAVRPDLAGAITRATDDDARAQVWAAHSGELRDYLRTQFFVPMADALAAAAGSYARLPWDPED